MKDVKAKILLNRNICADYYKMEIEASYIAKDAKPGQFVMVKCSDGLDPLLRRPLGVHRVKGKKEIEILYEVVGKGTEILSRRKPGESLDILGPLGNGFTLRRTASREPRTALRLRSGQAIIVAGGIGVAPLVFLAEELKRRKIKTIVLLGAKTKKLILCEKDFRKLGAEVRISTDDGTQGHKGFVSQLFDKVLRTMRKKRGAGVYACGPIPMLERIAGMCRKQRIDCEVLLEEKMACGIGVCLGCAVKLKGGAYKLACKDGPVFNATQIIGTGE